MVRQVLGHLADRIAGRLRAKHRAGRTVTVRVRTTLLEEVLFGSAIAPFLPSEPSDWWEQGPPIE